MEDVKRYWVHKSFLSDVPEEKRVGRVVVVLASDYDALQQRVQELEQFKKGVTPKHTQLLQRAEQAEAALVDERAAHEQTKSAMASEYEMDMNDQLRKNRDLKAALAAADGRVKELEQHCKELYGRTPAGIADREQERLNAGHTEPTQATAEEGKG